MSGNGTRICGRSSDASDDGARARWPCAHDSSGTIGRGRGRSTGRCCVGVVRISFRPGHRSFDTGAFTCVCIASYLACLRDGNRPITSRGHFQTSRFDLSERTMGPRAITTADERPLAVTPETTVRQPETVHARVYTFHVILEQIDNVTPALGDALGDVSQHPDFRGLLYLERGEARHEALGVTIWPATASTTPNQMPDDVVRRLPRRPIPGSMAGTSGCSVIFNINPRSPFSAPG